MTQLPEKQPLAWLYADHAKATANWGAKNVCRPAKEGEEFVRVERPQLRPLTPGGADRGFIVYQRGDYLRADGKTWTVVVAGKPFWARGTQGAAWRYQFLIVRPATDRDRAAVADALAAEEAESKAAMDRMMRS